jgi:hypothetical protein
MKVALPMNCNSSPSFFNTLTPSHWFGITVLAVTLWLGHQSSQAAEGPIVAPAASTPVPVEISPAPAAASTPVPAKKPVVKAEPLRRPVPVTTAEALTPPDAKSPVSVESKKGETLDKLIARAMSDSPLRADILRDAVVLKNPELFPGGKVRALPPAAKVLIPNVEDLRQFLINKTLAKAETAATPSSAAASPSADERRGWIRYP